ncbi:hypothetical protein [uncultured Treponema sp.]|uniref:hypothetical protein n=1 Tax=uncultured Treponema sp. TaxID=162155 RepID=UPI00260CBA6A|nr:hypothetical protein [uncultured Treponema sp.]
MEMMTMSATSTDLFNVSVEKGSANYQISISSKSALAAALIIGSAAVSVSENVSTLMFDRPIPYVYIMEDKSAVDTIPVADKIQKVLSFYNLGKSHLCKIIGISRPALYAWLDGSSEPDIENFAKVDQLYSMARELDISGNQTIYHGFVDKPLPGEGKSLYQLFIENSSLDIGSVKKLVQIAFNKSVFRAENIESRRASEFQISHSNADKELNFEENL